MIYSTAFSKLIDIFRSLPGVGQKSAVRMAYHILSLSEEQVEYIAEPIPENVRRYQELLPVFMDAYHALKEINYRLVR